MHMPFCTVADKCMQCDTIRAKREVDRLRGVLRTTMDELIAERDEVKDLSAKYARFETELSRLQTVKDKEIKYLWTYIRLIQRGKLSASEVWIPEEYRKADTPVPNSVMQGLFM